MNLLEILLTLKGLSFDERRKQLFDMGVNENIHLDIQNCFNDNGDFVDYKWDIINIEREK